MTPTTDECGQELLEVAPMIMRAVRTEMRRQRTPDLSVPQFRVLGFISRHPATSLSAVAEHIGQALPSMSSLVEGLVRRKLVARQFSTADRRRITLRLTARGETLLRAARQAARARLAERLAALTPDELARVTEALRLLRPLFAGPEEPAGPK